MLKAICLPDLSISFSCFISRTNSAAYYGSLVAPACVVLAINTIIFVMVTRVILKPRFQQQKQKESEGITPAQVIEALACEWGLVLPLFAHAIRP